jgi:hypothetical protein
MACRTRIARPNCGAVWPALRLKRGKVEIADKRYEVGATVVVRSPNRERLVSSLAFYLRTPFMYR